MAAAAPFEFISLREKAAQALDAISHALTACLLLLDDPFALIIRHSYGLDKFYRTFQPLNVLPLDIDLHSLTPTHALQADTGDEADIKHGADSGDGWDEWKWEDKSEAVTAPSASNLTSGSVSSNSATLCPAISVLVSSFLTPPLIAHIASAVATLRSSSPFAASSLFVFSGHSSQSHEAAGLSPYASIEAQLPAHSSVNHLPLSFSLLLPSVFFLPSQSSLSFTSAGRDAETAADVLPSLSSLSKLVKGRSVEEAKKAKHGSGPTSIPTSLPSIAASSSILSISAALISLLINLRVRPDVFSSGQVGHEVGQRVKNGLPRHLHSTEDRAGNKRAKTRGSSVDASREQQQQQAWQTASVVLVDRVHDMAVCSHTTHVLDRMYYTLRREEGAGSRVLSTSTLYAAINALHHRDDKECTMLLNALVNEPLPVVLRTASRLLASSSTAEASRGRRKGDVDVTKLREQVAQMEADIASRCAHDGLYQMTRAIVRAEGDDIEADVNDEAGRMNEQWLQLQSLERVCLSSLPGAGSTSSDSPLAPLVDLLQSPSAAARSLPLLSLLSLSSFLFSALGDIPLSDTHERQYRDALLQRVRADQSRNELVAQLAGSSGDAESFANRSVTLLQQMRYARATFSSSQLSANEGSDENESRIEPFVARLLSLCLDPAQSAADLEHHATELSTFDQMRLGARESLKAAALRNRGGGNDSAAAAPVATGNVHPSLSSFLSLGSSVVNKMTSSLSSSMAGGSSAASHPSQHSTLVLMVLGDVSWSEVSAMLRVAALHPACNVLIGCTGIADAEEMAWKTFAPPAASTAAGTVSAVDDR